jgi:hypothetical protein
MWDREKDELNEGIGHGPQLFENMSDWSGCKETTLPQMIVLFNNVCSDIIESLMTIVQRSFRCFSVHIQRWAHRK